MAATAEMVEQLRRMTSEPTNDTYHDAALKVYIESYPLLDGEGRDHTHNDWEPIYDLHGAAADIWEEKAAALVDNIDFTADGATFYLTRRTEQIMARVRYHRSQKTSTTMRLRKWPPEPIRPVWIGNLPEPEHRF